jgi:hypothetical protein
MNLNKFPLQGDFVVMNITNINKQAKLYSNDYRVHFRTPRMSEFVPLRNRVQYNRADPPKLRFSHKFECTGETLFAFCIPWSNHDNSRFLDMLDSKFRFFPDIMRIPTLSSVPVGVLSASTNGSNSSDAPACSGGSLTLCPGRSTADCESIPCEPLDREVPSRASDVSTATTRIDASATPSACAESEGLPPSDAGESARGAAAGLPQSDTGDLASSAVAAADAASSMLKRQLAASGAAAPEPLSAPGEESGIYYHRRVLAHSLQNRALEIITITDFTGWHEGFNEPDLKGTRAC